MRIKPGRFRLTPDDRVNLGKLPTAIERIYRDKKHYRTLLTEQGDQLSAL